MATELQYLSFMHSIPKWRRWCFPWFCKKIEFIKWARIVLSPKTALDDAMDHYFFAWCRSEDPRLTAYERYREKEEMKSLESYIKYLREKENNT